MANVDGTFYSGQTGRPNSSPESPPDLTGEQPFPVNPPGTNPSHDPLTIGTPPNGLSLSGQELSLALSSTSTTGALSSTDWNTFNSKIGGTIASGQVAFGTGANVIGGSSSLTFSSNIFKVGEGFRVRSVSAGSILSSGIESSTRLLIRTGGDSVTLDQIDLRPKIMEFFVSDFQDIYTVGAASFLRLQSSNRPLAIGNITPTNTLDVNGTTRIRTINNLGSNPASVLVPDATGVVSLRTLTEFKTDLGVGTISGTVNRVPKFTPDGSTLGDSRLIDDGTSAYFSNQSTNTFFGRDAGLSSDLAARNQTAFGSGAGRLNVSGTDWVALGYLAGQSSTSGSQWLAIGTQAGNTTNGGAWIAIGFDAARTTTGNNFTCIGYQAARGLTTGNQWVAVGLAAARYLSGGLTQATSMSNGVYLGYLTKIGTNGATNEIVIGHSAEGQGSNTCVIGNSSIVLTVLRGTVNMADLPTSSAGLNSGDVWNNSGVLNIV